MRLAYHDRMSVARQDAGRVNQKVRTERAILEAARELMRSGRTPTVAEVAEAALVSKATAYRYFPNQEELLLEASIATLPPPPADFGEGLGVVDRVDAMADRVLDFIRENERFWRTRIRTSLDRWLEGEDPGPLRRRNRLPWIRAALEPARGLLDAETHERLLRSLMVLTSGEAMIVLTDTLGLSRETAADTLRWAMRTMTQAVLEGVTG
jgi:AcrR family transcriptional regulator